MPGEPPKDLPPQTPQTSGFTVKETNSGLLTAEKFKPTENKSSGVTKEGELAETEFDVPISGTAESANIAVEINPDLSTILLKAIRDKGNPTEILKEDFVRLREEGKDDPLKTLLAIDLEMMSIQARGHDMSKIKEEMQKKGSTPGQDFKEELNRLAQRLTVLVTERKDFTGQPNQLIEIAKPFGVEGDELLIKIREKITAAIEDKVERQKLFEVLGRSDFPAKYEELKEELKRYVEHEKMEKSVKKYGKRAAMAGGAIGLMMVLSGWLAMKMESQRKQ